MPVKKRPDDELDPDAEETLDVDALADEEEEAEEDMM